MIILRIIREWLELEREARQLRKEVINYIKQLDEQAK